MMKLITLLSCVMITLATDFAHMSDREVYRGECEGVAINGVYHEAEKLVNYTSYWDFLEVDRDTNELYYINTGERTNDLTKLNLTSKEETAIIGVPVQAVQFAMNIKRKEIYVGGSSSLYKYNFRYNETTSLNARNIQYIFKMYFYNDTLYCRTKYFSSEWYVLEPGYVELYNDRVLEQAQAWFLAIDNDNVMYYTNKSGLFMHVRGNQSVFVNTSNREISHLTVDGKGDVYALVWETTDDEKYNRKIFVVNKETHQLDYKHGICDATIFTFDKDGNIVYMVGVFGGIYRLVPTDPYKVGTIIFLSIMCLIPLIYFGYFLCYKRSKQEYSPPADSPPQIADNAD